MRIRVGYELLYECPQPTPMVLMLTIHHTRAHDIVVPDRMIAEPFVPTTPYRDAFGNWCSRIVAPQGRLRLSATALLNDSGEPDVIANAEYQHAVEDLPEESGLPPRKPLLRDRSADRHRLGPVRQGTDRCTPRPGRLRLRAPPHHLRLPGCPIHQNRVGGSPGRERSLPRLRASGDRILPLPEHPGSLLHGLSRRHR